MNINTGTTEKTIATAVALSFLGLIGNYLSMPVAYGVSFIFGSIFSIIALRTLGFWLGVGVAFIASLYTYFLWNHPYAIVVFVAEIIWLGGALQKGKTNIVLIDSVFWLVLGAPLVFFFYYAQMHLGLQSTAIIVLKQSLNGILNALTASILLAHTPIASWLDRNAARQKASYSLIVFHIVSASLMLPTLGLVLLHTHRDISSRQERIIEEVDSYAREAEGAVASWVSTHVNAAKIIGELGSTYPLSPSSRLQEELERIHALFPSFHNVFLGDSTSTTIAFHPMINERGESTIGINFADRAWFKQLSSTLQPTISDIFMGRGGIFQPIFSISVPILRDGKFSHFGLGAVNVDSMSQFFELTGKHKELVHTVVDRNNNVVMSTDHSRKPLSPMPANLGGQDIAVSANVNLWVPGNQRNISIMDAWQEAYYYITLPIQGTPWTLKAEYPVGPLRKYMYESTIFSLSLVAIIYAIMITLAHFLSILLMTPLKTLSQISMNIPGKIENREPFVWPHSQILEVSELISNFTLTATTLENRLLETRERYKRLVEVSPSGIFICDAGGNYTYVSSKWVEITGLRESDALGKGLTSGVHPEDKKSVLSCFHEAQAHGTDYMSEFRFVSPSGLRWVLSIASASKVQGQVVDWVGTITDITERKMTTEALLKAHNELEQRVQERTLELQKTHEQLLHAEKMSAIGNLSASIAHEFNNPLQGVMGIVRGVKRRVELSKDDQELVDLAITECNRMKDLIKSLQDFNRPTSSRKAPMNIHAALDSILLLAKNKFQTKKITVEKKYQENLPQIMAVADQLKQVFLNLLNNASDACSQGGDITIETDRLDNNVVIRFHDTGCGITAENKEHIFEPFFTTKTTMKGTGLGLSVSYGIIKEHKGEITAESDPGKGTTFSVILPIEGSSGAEQ